MARPFGKGRVSPEIGRGLGGLADIIIRRQERAEDREEAAKGRKVQYEQLEIQRGQLEAQREQIGLQRLEADRRQALSVFEKVVLPFAAVS